MRIEARVPVTGSPDAVRAGMSDPTALSVTGARVEPTADGAWLHFEHPVPVAIRVALRPTERGMALQLVEGDLKELDGTLEVEPDQGGGSVVRVVLELAFPVGVPGTLLRELEARVPEWIAALGAVPQG